MHRQPTIDEIRAALEASKLPPKEDFERMVRRGLINRQGRLTRLFGGEAEPEPEALAERERLAGENGSSK